MRRDRPADDILARVKELVAELVDGVTPEEIDDDTPLFAVDGLDDGLALDSLDSLKLAMALAEEYGLDDLAEIDVERVATVREMAAYVRGSLTVEGER